MPAGWSLTLNITRRSSKNVINISCRALNTRLISCAYYYLVVGGTMEPVIGYACAWAAFTLIFWVGVWVADRRRLKQDR